MSRLRWKGLYLTLHPVSFHLLLGVFIWTPLTGSCMTLGVMPSKKVTWIGSYDLGQRSRSSRSSKSRSQFLSIWWLCFMSLHLCYLWVWDLNGRQGQKIWFQGMSRLRWKGLSLTFHLVSFHLFLGLFMWIDLVHFIRGGGGFGENFQFCANFFFSREVRDKFLVNEKECPCEKCHSIFGWII